jgi:Zn-dependent protease
MLITLRELLDILIMTVAVGYIFMDFLRLPRQTYGFDWKQLWLACLVTAPALIFHELAHKFTAILFGAQATFHAAYTFLVIGIVLKLVHSPIIFFVPGYVEIPASLLPLQSALVAFAGPALNGVLYLVAKYVTTQNATRSRRWLFFWHMTQRINGFLFIFNMLPIPGFDGLKVYQGLWNAFF